MYLIGLSTLIVISCNKQKQGKTIKQNSEVFLNKRKILSILFESLFVFS